MLHCNSFLVKRLVRTEARQSAEYSLIRSLAGQQVLTIFLWLVRTQALADRLDRSIESLSPKLIFCRLFAGPDASRIVVLVVSVAFLTAAVASVSIFLQLLPVTFFIFPVLAGSAFCGGKPGAALAIFVFTSVATILTMPDNCRFRR
tara:strand:+ start:330 stop:770 length:441 start_codon:yes stop_codon:yes gene_type:complete